VHENGSALEFGAGGRHRGVPEVAADVVDDLGPSFDGAACGPGMVGVDGQDSGGPLFEERFDDGEDSGLFFFGGQWGGVGAGGFAAEVEDVGSFVEHLEGLGQGSFGGVGGRVVKAAVGEGVGRDIKDSHDEGSRAEGEGAGAEMPVVMSAPREGHGEILDAGCNE